MKNYLQNGNTITLPAPYAVISGDGLLVGNIFGVASGDALIAEDVEAAIVGCFQLPKKTTDTPADGVLAYWDNTNKEVTTTSTSNALIGTFLKAQINGDTICDVRLNGAFTAIV
ncbi:MAG: DUF2190 family protein [gamma proteobacterium symbiont of Taylorina sp.]|nr:DUF2190 family protein [gamma proteobacterium symbiont of Taylorina sp.]